MLVLSKIEVLFLIVFFLEEEGNRRGSCLGDSTRWDHADQEG